MGAVQPVVRARRSAFAAAFLSFLFPGLGQAYLGRWRRGVAWAILPILTIVTGAGLFLSSSDRTELLAQLVEPSMLVGVIGFIVLDLLYRLAAVLDAYRLARDPGVGSAGGRMLSAVGLVAIILVLIASHVAVARPVYLAYDTINAVTENSGDDSEIPNLDDLGPDFAIEQVTTAPTATRAPGSTPAPEAAATPTPEATPAPSEGPPWDGKTRLNVLLIGADGGRQGPESYLTDTMIVVSVDPKTGRVAFISLPRDTSGIPLPNKWPANNFFGGKYNLKINTLYTVARTRPDLFPFPDRQRGYEALMGALSELFGLKIDYYIAVDLNSFRDAITTLGGVVIDVQVPVMDPEYPSDFGRGKLKLYVPPGMQYMNGPQALAYARSRHGSSDFDRAARQQRLISSVRDQTDLASLFAPGVIEKLLKQLTKYIKTNIPPKMIPRLVSLAQDVDLDRRETLVLSSPTYSTVCYPCPPDGLWVLKADIARMRKAAQNVFSGSVKQEKARLQVEDEGAVVHVLNGEGRTNTKATNIAELLALRGLNAVVPPVAEGRADRDDYTNTVITVYNGAGAEIPMSLERLKSIFKKAVIEEVDDPSQTADVTVTVGSKTRSLKAKA